MASWYYSMHGPELGKATADFSFPLACPATAGTKKASPNSKLLAKFQLRFVAIVGGVITIYLIFIF